MGPLPTRNAAGEYPAPVAQPRSSQELLPGSASYDLHPGIERAQGDLSVVKYQSSPLHPRAATGLEELLRARNIDTLIITGLVTNGCCDCTARDAFQYGYKTIIASDATAAMSDDEHNAALLNLEIYYAYVAACDAIIAALGAR
jgi:nicotinamidase-related amidase